MSIVIEIFQEQLNKLVIVYLDDILVCNETLETYKEHVEIVLENLTEHQLSGTISKYVSGL